MAPSVLIIVLTYNGVALTLDCLKSLEQLDYPQASVMVIDNGSRDGTPAAIRERHPSALCIETGSNLGFAAGNNLGLRYALGHGYDYALLLNNDVEVAPDFLNSLVETAEMDPTVGIAGPTIYYHEHPGIIWSAGGTIDWQVGNSAMRGLNQQDCGQYRSPAEVDFVTGCALLCKQPVLKKAGMLDERFFMYYEETEWCVRAKRAGYRSIHVPQSHIWHKISPEKQAASPVIHYYMTRNRLLFLRAGQAGSTAWRNTTLEYLQRLVSWTIRPKWRNMHRQRNAMLRGIVDYMTGRFGPAPFHRTSS